MRYILSILLTVFAVVSLHATTLRRDTVPDDEEDPYYLICGQADAAIKDGKFDEAAARLIDAMSVRPDSPQNILLLSNLGMVYSYMGRDSMALATLDEALSRARRCAQFCRIEPMYCSIWGGTAKPCVILLLS